MQIIGWDVGGAHLKAARAEKGVITQAVQIASPLWLGVDELDRAYAQAEAVVGRAPLNAITMTGEQCDAFATRAQGVAGLAAIMTRLLRPDGILFYAGRSGLVLPDQVEAEALAIASANWHASAALAGRKTGSGLFIDMGSTTTDIIPLHAGKPANLGFTDAERLRHGELVYTGLVRSFLMGGSKLVPFGGQWTALMNEWFATMADVHRVLGQLPEGADLMETSDGREKSKEASCARLARMIGRDRSEADEAQWERFAQFFAETQLRELFDAACLVLSRGLLPHSAPIVGAGVGRAVIRTLAERLRRPFLAFEDGLAVLPETAVNASHCAAAASVALLAGAFSGGVDTGPR